MFLRRIADSLEIQVKVVPRARRSEIVGTLGDRLKIRVAAIPEDGKANEALSRFLRDVLEADRVEIVAGHGAREKTIRLYGNLAAIEQRLRQLEEDR
jgi:uncharacterized protein (TIGR00251 family)